jgi:hypothetical protein
VLRRCALEKAALVVYDVRDIDTDVIREFGDLSVLSVVTRSMA